MVKRIKKIFTLLIIIAFLAPWVTPLAGDAHASNAHEGEEAHYCKVSKGPCKHGEFCPTKHHKKKEATEHEAHHVSHDMANDKASQSKEAETKAKKDGIPLLSSACHNSADTPISSLLSSPLPFVSGAPLTEHVTLIQLSTTSNAQANYKDAFNRPLKQPPKNS